MKRFYLFALLFLVSLPVLAKNKISMVTYFPVPYVAYSQVNSTEQMDIGLTSTCDMKLGCSDQSATLNAVQVNLKGGKLNLDGGRGIKGYTLSLGNIDGEGRISFQNVRIQAGNMESVNAQDMKVSALKLFGKTFPSCKEKDPSGQMQWASLKLKGASSNELYLACGDVISNETAECVEGETRGREVCNVCGTRTTSKCINGKWTSFLGACSKNSSSECPKCPTWVAYASTWADGCVSVQVGQTITDSVKQAALEQALASAGARGTTPCPTSKNINNQCSMVGDVCYSIRWEGFQGDYVYCVDLSKSVCSNEKTVSCSAPVISGDDLLIR